LREELLLARGGRPRASRAFNALLPLFGAPFHYRDRLHEVDAPTLLLWGEADDGFPLPVAIDARTRMPHAELVVVPAGHSPHVEAPFQTLARIEAFIARVDSRTGSR
jgi:pimeloyl-ACP methyl ester carboxylesterase